MTFNIRVTSYARADSSKLQIRIVVSGGYDSGWKDATYNEIRIEGRWRGVYVYGGVP